MGADDLAAAEGGVTRFGPRTLRREVLLVFSLSLGASGVYAVVSLLGKLTAGVPLASQVAPLNSSHAPGRPTLDLVYQLLDIGFAIVPVLLAGYFLALGGERPLRVLGLDVSRPAGDLGLGTLLAAVIGGSGLGLVLVARHLGVSATIVASGLPDVWWRIPVLLLAAAQNALLEETLVVGYLLHRLAQLGWRPGRALAASAVLRGSYHLYQGVPAFLGNAVMGVIFGRVYQLRGRTAPLVVAHFLIDAVAFVGYALLAGKVSWLP